MERIIIPNNPQVFIAPFGNGRPSSGKDTQAELIAKLFGIKRYSTGEDLIAAKGDPTHPFHDEVLDQDEKRRRGILVASDLILRMVRYRYATAIENGDRGIVATGVPRTEGQDAEIRQMMAEYSEKYGIQFLPAYFCLSVTPDRARKMAKHRRETMATPREDDAEEVVERRLSEYASNTEPMLRAIHRRGDLILVKANGPYVKEFPEGEDIQRSINEVNSRLVNGLIRRGIVPPNIPFREV